MTAKFLVWAFFLLVADQALVIMGSKFGLPVKPTYVYAVIACAAALIERCDLRRLAAAKGFFLPFFAIVLVGAAELKKTR
jgi:hypothetical protein